MSLIRKLYRDGEYRMSLFFGDSLPHRRAAGRQHLPEGAEGRCRPAALRCNLRTPQNERTCVLCILWDSMV